MIKIESGIEPVKTERCAEAKAAIRVALEDMKPGQSFLIAEKIRRGTVKALAKVMEIKVKIEKDGNNNWRCWRV
jgi:hypothetical protein